MEFKISKSASDINNKRIQKKYCNISPLYSKTESTFRNKFIKKNNSQKIFNNKKNLKLTHNVYNTLSNSNSERRILTTLTTDEIAKIKNTILQKFEENKNKRKLSNEKNYCNTSNNSSRTNRAKIIKRNKVENILDKIEKKFEKYNKEKIAYNVYHDYQKLKINKNYNFLERMELYTIKKELKENTINDYIKIKSPKLSKNEKNRVFDFLINDIKIRKQKKERQEKENKEFNFLRFNNSKTNLKTKKVNEKEINEIVKRLSKPKRYLIFNNIKNKENNNDININNGGKIKEKKENKNKIMKSFSTKSIKKEKQIEEINNRLYKKEMDKKDIAYKLVMKNVNELLKNNKIKSYIKNNNNNNNNDIITYDQLKQMRNKNKMMNLKTLNNNNKEYKFKDDEENFDDDKNNDNKNNTNYKGIKTHNNFRSKNYNELFSFSGPQNNNSINNLKISIMIDNFFSNK